MRVMTLLMMLLLLPLVYAVPVSFSDQGTDLTLNGAEVTSGDLGITIWDAASGGNQIYAENFSLAIVNGSWNVILNDSLLNSLEFGRKYWKDYTINDTDLDFSGDERIALYASVGLITNQSIVNASAVSGWSTNGSVATTTQNVGIGTTNPSALLHVAGNLHATNVKTDTANESTSIGENTGSRNRTTYVGWKAGQNFTGPYATIIGRNAGRDGEGQAVTFLGNHAGDDSIGEKLTSLGRNAGRNNVGNQSVFVGVGAGSGNVGYNVTALGFEATNNNNGDNNIGIGFQALNNNAANNVVAIGYEAGESNTVSDQFIVHQNNVNAVPLIQGNFSSGNVGIGTTTPEFLLTVGSGVIGGLNSNVDLAVTDTSDARIAVAVDNSSLILRGPTPSSFVSIYGYNYTAGQGMNLILNRFGGNVGIGTISPNHLLDVDGQINASNINASGDICITGGNCLSTASGLWTNTSGNATYVGGNVGVGTTSPNVPLEVESTTEALRLSYNSSNYASFTTESNGGLTLDTTGAGSEISISPVRYLNLGTGGTDAIFVGRTDINVPTTIRGRLSVTNASGTQGLYQDNTGNVGIGTTSPTSLLNIVDTLSDASGDEVAFNLTYTTNKAAGDDTGLVINQINTTSPGTSLLADFQVDGVTQISIQNSGDIFWAANTEISRTGSPVKLDMRAPDGLQFRHGSDITDAGTVFDFAGITAARELTASSGTTVFVDITPEVEQTSTAGYTALQIDVEETSTGSGTNLLADFQVNGTSKLVITNIGRLGIGTTAPGEKLHVNGSINVTTGEDICITGGNCLSSVTGSSLWTNTSGNATYVNGNVGIGTTTPNYTLSVGSPDAGQEIAMFHNNTDANMRWSNGWLHLTNDNATENSSRVQISGTGDNGRGILILKDGDSNKDLRLTSDGLFFADTEIKIQHNGNYNTEFFSSANEGETPEVEIHGFRTGDSKRALEIGVGINAVDTVSFDGLGNYNFDGDVNASNFIATTDICITGGNCLSTAGGNVTGMTQWLLDTDTGDIFTVTNNTLINITSGASITSTHNSGNITIDVADNSIDGTELADSITLDANLAFDGGGDVTFNTTVLHIDNTNSRVGIGTASPSRALHINDVMRVEPRSAAPSSPAEGDIYFDADLHKPCYYNSTAWVTFDDSTTCS